MSSPQTSDKIFKMVGVILILVGLYSLGNSVHDICVYVSQKMPPGAKSFFDKCVNFLGLIPPILVGWAPWVFAAFLALGVGLRMATGRFFTGDKDKGKGKDGPA